MNINEAGFAIIRRNEGCRLVAYQDIAGVWTIGYGHTGPEVLPGNQITQEQANLLLRVDINRFAWGVATAARDVPTTENQLSAMTSLAFNIGINAFRRSSVLRLHRAGDYQGAARAFHMWNKSHVDGQLVVVSGLEWRRTEESNLYLSGATSTSATLPDLDPSQVVGGNREWSAQNNPLTPPLSKPKPTKQPSEADALNRQEYQRHLKDGR